MSKLLGRCAPRSAAFRHCTAGAARSSAAGPHQQLANPSRVGTPGLLVGLDPAVFAHSSCLRLKQVSLWCIPALLLLGQQLPAAAHIAFDKPMQQEPTALTRDQAAAGFDPAAAAAARASLVQQYRAKSTPSLSSSRQSNVALEAQQAMQQLAAAEAAARAGDCAASLAAYTGVVQQHPDLALSEYARLGRAIMLYQVGDVSGAILTLEDQEVAMRGSAEVHAALAAVLYAERPAQRLRAEQQFDIALEFDSRYEDAAWVEQQKHWPPALLAALRRFLLLQ